MAPSGGDFSYLSYDGRDAARGRKQMVGEAACTIVVNGQEWVNLLCSPSDLEALAVGFLFDAEVIGGIDDVSDARVTEGPQALGALVEVRLASPQVTLPARSTFTSGCSGGITFYDLAAKRAPLVSDLRVTPEQVYRAMAQLMTVDGELHNQVGGFHTSALSDGRGLLIVMRDVGRHNTLDKIAGEALRRGIETRDRLLVTTGRVSTEMLAKAARMGSPVVISRNSPTGLAVHLAREWRITVAGYVRGSKMHVYSAEERIVAAPAKEPAAAKERA